MDHGGLLLYTGSSDQGVFVRGSGHFCLPKPGPILREEEAEGSEGKELRELFACTLTHPDQSPGIRSLCVRQTPSNKTWRIGHQQSHLQDVN